MAMNIGLNGSELLHILDLGQLCRLVLVDVPVIYPREKPFVFVIHHTVDLPVELGEPLQLHLVEFMYRNAADFSPGSILERVVIEKLAAKEQASCKHSVDRAGGGGRRATLIHLLHP